MNIIIPLGGIGQRFVDSGYNAPKPLVRLFFKPIIFWLLDCLELKYNDRVYLIANPSLKKYRFEDEIKKKHPKVKVIYLNSFTKGAAETILLGAEKINNNNETLLLDGDTFYSIDILSTYRQSSNKNIVFCFEQQDDRPIYSYVKYNQNNKISEIAEKEKISPFANTGAYGFKSLDLLKKYCNKVVEENIKFKSEFYTSTVISYMINEGHDFYAETILDSEFDVVGTPFQYKLFHNKFLQSNQLEYFKGHRVCFDLDNTLVTFPKKTGDYRSVEPIEEMIEYCRFLKKLGCTIIIYTARRMATHKGNEAAALADIGKITLDTLQKFKIPFDEMYFGKPYAHAYIDDLAVNSLSDYQQELGVSNFSIDEREFNNLEEGTIPVIDKQSEDSHKLKGEIMWYQNLPPSLKKHTPALISYDSKSFLQYRLERVNGLTFSELFLAENLTIAGFKKLLNTLHEIHNFKAGCKENIYENYFTKLDKRYKSHDYSKFKNNKSVFNSISKKLELYEEEDRGKCGIIHGDPVFSNVLLDKFGAIKLIDPRGVSGDKITTNGDIFYDYAKVYQSLLGYDEILQDKSVSEKYRTKMMGAFESFIANKFEKARVEDIKLITNSLLFSLIPLHDNEKCLGYYNLISI